MPFSAGQIIVQAFHDVALRNGPQTRARTAVIRASGEILNAGVAVGSAGLASFETGRTLQAWLTHAADRIAGLSADVAQSVFGKAGLSGADTTLTAAQETAVARATSGAVSLIRRYTNQPGVVEVHSSQQDPITTVNPDLTIGAAGQWFHINGLANDEVFLVQRIRYVKAMEDVGTEQFMGFVPFRPYGFFSHTGGSNFFPREGEDFLLSSVGIHTLDEFFRETIGTVNFGRNDTVNTNPSTAMEVIDLSPNFLPIRSYQVWRTAGLGQEVWKVELYGKTVKWLLPIETAF